MYKHIKIYEHQRLYVGEQGFNQKHLDALLKLNEYHDWKYFRPISKGIQFNQYVGIIQIDGLSIEIHPKADKNDDDSKWQGVLLHMLQASGKLNPESAGAANVKRTNLNLLEVYFELYLSEIDNLLHKGCIKQYRKQTSNTKALKGKLEFAGHIQKNLVHKERFYTTHQVYDTNHLLHQTLYNALEIVGQFTKGTRLHDRFKRLDLNFPEVSRKNITKQQVNSIKLNRKSASYSYGLELARLIILNYSPNISGGKEKMVSLLFDMNVLWEEYILKQLQKHCEGTNIEVFGQESKSFWGNNSLRPDIVLKKEGKTYIIDTKWKCPNNSSASVADLRQMYTYCRFWNAEKALLLYPGTDKNNEFKPFKTDDYIVPERIIKHQCKMRFVSVVDNEGNLSETIGEEILKELIENN
ncbi:restriction endonuclease [Tenacibaculum sp. Bg11-29]|uniref:McrC family protein n=1 Tax=Tenacibaculum sp. Bg11-29 TaxID=2058306 RepID=UPI000C3490A0|nr:restriction endonuclease [Tenacibaculum sp. Bg11-29]PKH52151.1 restriction endonuclease [Tenacibaculum sp. Bg11-29]